MDKLIQNLKKELTELGEKGINASNIELVETLGEAYKNLLTAKAMEEQGSYGYSGNYENSGGSSGGNYNNYRGGEMRYEEGRYRGNYQSYYGNQGYQNSGRGRYSNTRMREHMDRMMDGMDQYEYGKERYMHSGDENRIYEGLEKLMYAMCMFVESAMDFAETPEEKEIIRKHIQKISRI